MALDAATVMYLSQAQTRDVPPSIAFQGHHYIAAHIYKEIRFNK